VYESPLHDPASAAGARNIHIEGDLCRTARGSSATSTRTTSPGAGAALLVQRPDGVGIGTYVATDPDSESPSASSAPSTSQPRASTDRVAARQAYRLDGELNAANRGIADLMRS
jgi:hypothetical protein